jgi:hypothetical protein
VFQCGASGRSLLASRRVEFNSSDDSHFGVRTDGVLESERNLFHVRTRAVILLRTGNLIRPDVRNRFAPFRGSARPNVIKTLSGRVPHKGYKLPRSSLSPSIPHKIFSLAPCEYIVFSFWSDLIFCVHSYSHSRYLFFISFSSFYNC